MDNTNEPGERTVLAQAIDAATGQPHVDQPQPEARFELSFEGRVNLLVDLTGKAMQGMLSADESLRGRYEHTHAIAAVQIARRQLEAIEREVDRMMKDGQSRG